MEGGENLQSGETGKKSAGADPMPVRFDVLDGLRGLAALVVIVDHVPSAIFDALLPGRYLAVDFFFVLSGFVISYVYGARITQGLPVLGFLRVRVIRFAPLHVVATLLGAAIAYLFITKGWGPGTPRELMQTLAFNMIFLPTPPRLSIDPNALFPLVGPAWSLFFELAINAPYALIATWLTLRRLVWLLLVSGLILVIVVMRLGTGDGGWAWSHAHVGAARVTFSFFAGVLVYRLYSAPWFRAIPAWLPFVVLAGAFIIPATGQWRPIFDLFAMIVVFPLLVAFAAKVQVRGYALLACIVAGALSYGVYVFHVPLKAAIDVSLGYFFGFKLVDMQDGAVVLVTVATVAVAAVAHTFYDVPLRKWLSRFGGQTDRRISRAF